MIQGRDSLFQELFSRSPTKEEMQRFDRMASLMGLTNEDSMWYVIIVNEFYDQRLRTRLTEVDRVADHAADKALIKIAESVINKAEILAAEKNRGFMWRSWGLLMSCVVVLCAVVLNAGFVMGSGQFPFWLKPANGLQQVMGWFLNVPSGWILLLGTSPFLVEIILGNVKKISVNKRLGLTKENPRLVFKSIGSFAALLFILVIVFSV